MILVNSKFPSLLTCNTLPLSLDSSSLDLYPELQIIASPIIGSQVWEDKNQDCHAFQPVPSTEPDTKFPQNYLVLIHPTAY